MFWFSAGRDTSRHCPTIEAVTIHTTTRYTITYLMSRFLILFLLIAYLIPSAIYASAAVDYAQRCVDRAVGDNEMCISECADAYRDLISSSAAPARKNEVGRACIRSCTTAATNKINTCIKNAKAISKVREPRR